MRGDKLQTLNSDSKVAGKVDLNQVKEEEKKSRRTNIAVSAAAVSALAVFGIILTL